jgi:hypothetical protein
MYLCDFITSGHSEEFSIGRDGDGGKRSDVRKDAPSHGFGHLATLCSISLWRQREEKEREGREGGRIGDRDKGYREGKERERERKGEGGGKLFKKCFLGP